MKVLQILVTYHIDRNNCVVKDKQRKSHDRKAIDSGNRPLIFENLQLRSAQRRG